MGLLTKYVLFAQLIVLILFILPVLVLAKQMPADSIYVSYPLAIINITLLIVIEILIILVYNRNSIITSISNQIKESVNDSMQIQMHEQNRMNNNQQGSSIPKFLNKWIPQSQSLESIQITPVLINQVNRIIDHATRDIKKLV